MKMRRYTIGQIVTKIVNALGFTSMLIGYAGIAGNIEQGKSLAVPLIVLISGALMLGATSMLEIIEDEKKNRNSINNHHRDDARPYFLRR